MDDLVQEFIAETRETLEALAGEIVAWEAAPDDRARLDAIFRFVHTVKGSCGFLDLPRLSRLSHAAEDALSEVRDGRRHPDRRLVDAVLAIVDRIGLLVEAIDSGQPLSDVGEDLLIAALTRVDAPVPEVDAAEKPDPRRAPQRTVRLNVDLLDQMMSGMSDMVLVRNELARRLRDIPADPALEAAMERLSTSVADMRDAVTRTRMQKVETLFAALPRMVRHTAATLGKTVMLTIEGENVELDREMVEVMRDPLVHVIRNAIDHGIEGPAERRAVGKRERGRLHVTARQSGNQVVIEVADDGRGIDTARLMDKLAASGRRRAADLHTLSERERYELIFTPGLSSRDHVTEISGRGVGMDVVKAAVDQIGGRITLDSQPGRGLRIVMQVPLTLSIVSALIVRTGGQGFAIPRQAIVEIVRTNGPQVRIDGIGGARVATIRDRRMALVDLNALTGLEPQASDGGAMLVVVAIGAGEFAIAVDGVCDTEDLVVKPAAPMVMTAGLYAGQTLPDTGEPMLLLDCAGVADLAGLQFTSAMTPEPDEAEAAAATGTPALLFHDLDGRRRVVALGAIDRIETMSPDRFVTGAGQVRVTIDGRIVPVEALGSFDGRSSVELLRLTDGLVEVAYAMHEAIDIVTLAEPPAPAAGTGPVAGVVTVAGEQIELIDALWLFERHAPRSPIGPGIRPACLLSDAGGWMGMFLRPILEQAGYRTIDRVAAGERPALVLAQVDGPVPADVDVPVVRLRDVADDCGDGSIYRYDREGLLRAMRRAVGGEA